MLFWKLDPRLLTHFHCEMFPRDKSVKHMLKWKPFANIFFFEFWSVGYAQYICTLEEHISSYYDQHSLVWRSLQKSLHPTKISPRDFAREGKILISFLSFFSPIKWKLLERRRRRKFRLQRVAKLNIPAQKLSASRLLKITLNCFFSIRDPVEHFAILVCAISVYRRFLFSVKKNNDRHFYFR